jgi:E3 ubiquitin-protein ligase BRE1
VSAEKTQLELRLQRSQTALAEAQATAHTRVAEATADRAALTKAQDELAAAERTLAKMKAKQEALMSAAAGSGASAQEVQIREEREKLLKLLRCSCCERNLKQQVIVKCMHTFCKE